MHKRVKKPKKSAGSLIILLSLNWLNNKLLPNHLSIPMGLNNDLLIKPLSKPRPSPLQHRAQIHLLNYWRISRLPT